MGDRTKSDRSGSLRSMANSLRSQSKSIARTFWLRSMLPPSPNFNAHTERFFGLLKSECLDRLILFGERSMRNAVKPYLEHDHIQRPPSRIAKHVNNGKEAIAIVGRQDRNHRTAWRSASIQRPSCVNFGAVFIIRQHQAMSLLRPNHGCDSFGKTCETTSSEVSVLN